MNAQRVRKLQLQNQGQMTKLITDRLIISISSTRSKGEEQSGFLPPIDNSPQQRSSLVGKKAEHPESEDIARIDNK